MKVGIITQMYGMGPGTLEAYYSWQLAQHLKGALELEVFTTTAISPDGWKDFYESGVKQEGGVIVNRFSVSSEGDGVLADSLRKKVLFQEHKLEEELLWLKNRGPFCPDIIDALSKRYEEFDLILFISFNSHLTVEGIRRFGEKSVLVPLCCSLNEELNLKVFKDFFRSSSAIIFGSSLEKEAIIGFNPEIEADDCLIMPPFVLPDGTMNSSKDFNGKIYIAGGLENQKESSVLMGYFKRLQESKNIEFEIIQGSESPGFLMEGGSVSRNLVSDSYLVIVPQKQDLLNMGAVGAWGLGKPLLVNGTIEALKNLCLESCGGLWYRDYYEFQEVMELFIKEPALGGKLGENGYRWVKDRYNCSVFKETYLKFLKNLIKSRLL